ncbi:MAG TPA: hypothetical protein DCG33_00670, partial [Prevotellaceae bacterium]|nr:hypothetical protein [Prevotellaceae bacterium]
MLPVIVSGKKKPASSRRGLLEGGYGTKDNSTKTRRQATDRDGAKVLEYKSLSLVLGKKKKEPRSLALNSKLIHNGCSSINRKHPKKYD